MSNGNSTFGVNDYLGMVADLVGTTPSVPSPGGGDGTQQTIGDLLTGVVPAYGGIVTILSLLRLLATPPGPPPPPDSPLQSGIHEAQVAVQQTYDAITKAAGPSAVAWLAAYVVGAVVLFIAVVGTLITWVSKILVPPIASAGLNFIDAFREELDPQVARLAVQSLNEILGTEFTTDHLPSGSDITAHIARAGAIGGFFHKQLISEFSPAVNGVAQPTANSAERFTGMIVNFGMATAILGLAGELGSLGLFKDFRLLGEQISSGLGLSRLHRLAMRPLLTTAVATPYQWYLNQLWHPTQFKAAEIANPFAQTLLPADQIAAALDLEGYSPEKIAELIKLHQKRLTIEDVEILKRWGYWDETVTHQYIVNLGWPEELADTVGRIPELRRIDGRITKLIDTLESNVDQGHMAIDDALAIIKTLAVTPDELAIIQATMITKTKVPHKSLTLTEIENAFNTGLFTIDDVTARLTQAGFIGDDLNTLVMLILLKFAEQQEAKKVAQFVWEQKVAKAKAKGLPEPPQPKILLS
jgi:hypothetical protein